MKDQKDDIKIERESGGFLALIKIEFYIPI